MYEDFAWTPTSNFTRVTVGTAPADGYVYVYAISRVYDGTKYLSIESGDFMTISNGGSGTSMDLSCMLFVNAGDSIDIISDKLTNETPKCRFYYSVNSAKELGLI